MSSEEEIQKERQAVARLKSAIETIGRDAQWYWHWGDGEGGYVMDMLAERIRDAGYYWPLDSRVSLEREGYKKGKISRALSKRVFERDAYRCVTCETHIDLCCDHIIPESKGGETTFENLQTMCRPCNSRKGTKLG